MKVENISSLSDAIKKHQYYRASLLSANLVESGFSLEQVMIIRRTAEGRSALQDIEDITIKYPYLNPDRPYIEIESGRAGIYDAMPEGLFFTSGDSGRERDKRYIIERIRGNRELEKYVRQFMHLFEVESDSLRTQIDVEELKYDKCRVYRHLPEFYAQYWSVFSLMSTGEVLRMLKVIPYIPSLQDDLQGAAKAISFILNLRVTVEKRLTEIVSQEDTTPILSELRLGDNFVLSGCNENTLASMLVITVAELNASQCEWFFGGQPGEKIIRSLSDLFFSNTSVQIVIELNSGDKDFFLSQSYLGINTYL